ncbi:hypothetical protein ACHAPJ_011894 [Fusarium lateritium]
MADRYVALHQSPSGPGDSRPTAIQIIKDEGLEGKLNDQVILVTGCSSGIGIETAKALHPTGAVLTDLPRHLSDEQKDGMSKDPYLEKIWKAPDQGAATSVWAATAKALEGQEGKYLENCQIIGKYDPSAHMFAPGYGDHAYDTEKAKKLWEKSLEWVGL